MTAKRRKPLFERLKQGLEEGIAHTQGELTQRTVEVPEEPPSATDSFRKGWKEAQSCDTLPVGRLWEGLDVER